MKELLHLLRTHWRLIVLVLVVLLLLPAVVAAADEEQPPPSEPVSSEPVPSEPAPSEPPAAPSPSAAAPSFSEFQQMIERPLFSSTRRPPVLDDAPQDNLDAQQLREAWRLNGIALEQGRQLAIFSERQGARRLLLEVGMVLADDWRLERIGTDHVLLSNGSSQVEMPLHEPIEHQEPPEPPADKEKPGKPAKPQAPTDKTTTPAGKPAAAAPAKKG